MKSGHQTIGFIGLGQMGNPIACRLNEEGFALVVHDANALAVLHFTKIGVAARSDAKGIADASDIVMVCLPTPEIVRAVVTGSGGVNEGRRARYVIDISTTGPRIAREMSGILAENGKIFIDAPVTGGVAGAKSGILTMMLGAPENAIEAVRPVLETVARKLVIAGSRAGDGQMLKVINNLLSFIALEATAEAMTLGVKAGLDPDTMLQAINAGTGRNSATEEKFPRSVVTRSFDFGFSVRGVMKDIGLCLSEAEAMGVPMPVGMCARQIWTMAMAEHADHDMTSIVKLFERWAGVEVKSTKQKQTEPREAVAVG
jgi:3-hydroxyisobutyrate dehydrogenase-like beta-hydroxyacid dehydrogenase